MASAQYPGDVENKAHIDTIETAHPQQSENQLDHGDLDIKHDAHLTLVDDQLAAARAQFSYDHATKLKRKADRRLLPLLVFAYLVKNIDNNLPGYLKTMNTGTPQNILTELHMTNDQYALISTCFAVGFVISEVPSNMIIKWSTPRLHFVRIMVSWSIINACHAACKTRQTMYVCRALLGLMEGGLYPGIAYQLTCWYRPDEIALRLACMQLLGQLSGIVDAFLCYGLIFISGRGGLSGWQWAFVITGLLGFVSAGLLYWLLPDWPDSPQTRWRSLYTEEEGQFMVARLPPTTSRSGDADFDWRSVKRELTSPLLYGFAAINLFLNSASYGVNFWLPTIVAGFGLTSTTNSQLLNVPVAAVYVLAALVQAWLLDNTTRIPKPLMMITYLGILAGLFFGLMFCENKYGLYIILLICSIPLAGVTVTLMPLRVQSVRGSASSAFAVAFMNTMGNIPTFYTAQFFLSKYAPTYRVSFGICVAFMGACAAAVAFVWWLQWDVEKNTRKIAAIRRARGKRGEVIDEDVVA